MTEIRFITCGDAHIYGGVNGNNGRRLQRVVGLANDAFAQGKLDFIVFVGDIADTVNDTPTKEQDAATIINMLNPGLTRYKCAGNHDVLGSPCISNCPTGNDQSCVFRTYQGVYPEQFYLFQKTGKTFNIIIPGICIRGTSWSTIPNWYYDFNNPSINKTLPTLVFDHGPVYKFSNWDSYDMYAQGMASELQKFNALIGIYAGHVHEATNNMVGNVRQVTNQATASTEFVGYTRVNDNNSTDYTTIRYQNGESQAPFVDPFPTPVVRYRCSGTPDFLCIEDPNGPYDSLAACQAVCKPPTRYRCSGSPDFLCIEDPNGPYATLAECQAACVAPIKRYRCTGSPDFLCVEDPNGPYDSLAACQAACVPQAKKFKIFAIGSQGVTVIKSSIGDHTADEACKDTCDMIKNIN